MDSLTKDVLFNIATMLDLDNLLSFCNSDPRINRLICQGEAIWNFKLMKEFPDYKDHINKRGREAYELLIGLIKLKGKIGYPGTIYQLYNEKGLDLFHRGLKSIPSEIGNLSNLRFLYLNNNQIKSIPPEIGKLRIRNIIFT
jgi:Leucine-rich repeat (LRR) protein